MDLDLGTKRLKRRERLCVSAEGSCDASGSNSSYDPSLAVKDEEKEGTHESADSA